MKAFLLAAGMGTRLRPITNNTPKCLVPIGSKPLLEYWIDLFKKYNITEVLINTHYLSGQVEEYIKNQKQISFILSYEKELLGSAGTLFNNRDFINNEEFYILYADNLTNINLFNMLNYHKKKHSNFTMGLFHCNNPNECGIAQLDKFDKIIDFIEKPDNPISNLANAGIYLTNSSFFDYITKEDVDLAKDVIPRIPDKYGYILSDYLLDIGTIKNFIKAQEDHLNGII